MKDMLLKMNKARIRSVLGILLCLMLVCGAVMSATVFAEETAAEAPTETSSEDDFETAADSSDSGTSSGIGTDASVGTSTGVSAETSTAVSTGTTTGTSTDTSTETGAEASLETSTGTTTGTSTDTSTETGTETSSETGTETTTGSSTDALAETSSEASSETGINAAAETVAESSVEKSQDAESETAASETASDAEAADASTESTAEADTEAAEETDSAAGMPTVELTGSVGDITVAVSAPEGAFAEGVTMVVEDADKEAFDAAVQADLDENYPGTTYTILDSAVIEITFYDTEGNEVQPETEVEVTISGLSLLTEVVLENLLPIGETADDDIPSAGEEPASDLSSAGEEPASDLPSGEEESGTALPDLPSDGETLPDETLFSAEELAGPEAAESVLTAAYALIYHMDDEGNVECIADETPGESTYTFTTDRFSEYGVTNVSEENGISVTAGGGGGNQGGGTGGGPGSGGQTEGETDSGSSTTYTYYHMDLRVSSTVDITVTNSAETTTDVTVTKVWENDDEDDRPGSITVYLTDDSGNYITDSGGDYITATLTAANNWTYTWEGLSLEEGTYTVTEDDVSGYTMTDATTFEIVDASTATSVTYTGTITVDRITSLIVTHDGVDYEVEMSSEKTLDENDNVYEFASVAGHGSNGNAPTYTLNETVDLKEGDTITVTVVYSYYYMDSDGNEYSGSDVTTTVTITVDEDDNICDGTAGTDQYGFDFKITALQLLEAESALTDDQELTITNTAESNTAAITVTKEVTGNMSDTTKEFTFTLTDSNGDPVGTLDSTGSALTASGFTLSDGESESISDLTVGDTVYLAESDNENYMVTVTDSSGNEISPNSDGLYEITVDSGVSITVTNYYNIEPDTGFDANSTPYTALLSGEALAGIVALIDRRRRLF
ncbi:MAG: Cna B-type domain-containing protein [Lachnospiraceae bacterium]|nr:Cna B-type domain-containing protein [Lachnospiraceae bacterium]